MRNNRSGFTLIEMLTVLAIMGIIMGIGYALYEKVVWQDGRMANNQMTNYIMPTSEDVPPIHVFFEEIPFRHGGYGAKGVGEIGLVPTAAAVASALWAFDGIRRTHLPMRDSAAARG